jgi:hypothetical protein
MARPLRIEYSGAIYHVLSRGTGAKQSSEVTLIENYSWIYRARVAGGPGGRFTPTA